jgi:hypothetical protein
MSGAPIEKVKKAFKTNEGSYADKLWNSCYLFSEMYHRDNWKFEFPPNNTGFYSWVCREFPNQVHSKSDVMARIDIYDLYSSFDNLEVVRQVKKMAVTKTYGIRQFVETYPDKVLAILKTGLKLNGEELYAALRSEFPLDEDDLPRDTVFVLAARDRFKLFSIFLLPRISAYWMMRFSFPDVPVQHWSRNTHGWPSLMPTWQMVRTAVWIVSSRRLSMPWWRLSLT